MYGDGVLDLFNSQDMLSIPIDKRREAITLFEHAISLHPGSTYGDTELMPLEHFFAPGMYIRKIFIPKGTVTTTRLHKTTHPSFIMQGSASVFTEKDGLQKVCAPMVIITTPGTKRVIHALEDVVWVTVHATDKTDLLEIERDVIAKGYDEVAHNKKGVEMSDDFYVGNCLYGALRSLGRDVSALLGLDSLCGYINFKEALDRLKKAGVSLSGIEATKVGLNTWHAYVSDSGDISDLVVSDSDMVGTFAGSAVVGGGVIGLTAGLGALNAHNASNQASRARQAAQEQYQFAQQFRPEIFTPGAGAQRDLFMQMMQQADPRVFKRQQQATAKQFNKQTELGRQQVVESGARRGLFRSGIGAQQENSFLAERGGQLADLLRNLQIQQEQERLRALGMAGGFAQNQLGQQGQLFNTLFNFAQNQGAAAGQQTQAANQAWGNVISGIGNGATSVLMGGLG